MPILCLCAEPLAHPRSTGVDKSSAGFKTLQQFNKQNDKQKNSWTNEQAVHFHESISLSQ